MPESGPFERYTERYEGWFDTHEAAYQSEAEALQRLIPQPGSGIETGVGGARFASPLGMEIGLDPAGDMLVRARERGIDVVTPVPEDRLLVHEPSSTAFDSMVQLAVFHRGWTAGRDGAEEDE